MRGMFILISDYSFQLEVEVPSSYSGPTVLRSHLGLI